MNPVTNSQGVTGPEAGLTDPQAAEKDVQTNPSEVRFSCVYFGYGSNLSPRTMKQRCPDSLFIGLASVKGWRWQINETGYANIVPGGDDDIVYGSLCFLSQRDEDALDESEGVPWLYEKQKIKVKRLIPPDQQKEYGTDDNEVEATTYVDVQRTTDGPIEKEYITWIRKAIEDGNKCGMPDSYVQKYVQPVLPAKEGPESDIVMVRTMRFGERDSGMIPRGFASWSRG